MATAMASATAAILAAAAADTHEIGEALPPLKGEEL